MGEESASGEPESSLPVPAGGVGGEGDHQGDGVKPFKVVQGKRTRASRYKLKEKRFRVDIRE